MDHPAERVHCRLPDRLGQRRVRVDGEVFEDAARVFVPGFEGVLAVGKRNFARVRLVAAS